jgi:hypothetical protein
VERSGSSSVSNVHTIGFAGAQACVCGAAGLLGRVCHQLFMTPCRHQNPPHALAPPHDTHMYMYMCTP